MLVISCQSLLLSNVAHDQCNFSCTTTVCITLIVRERGSDTKNFHTRVGLKRILKTSVSFFVMYF